VGSWVAVALTSGAQERVTSLTGLVAEVWPVLLLSVYVPMLYLVLRRPR
jgi:hypothetical protein